MSKYEKLWKHIQEHSSTELSFDEVRQICGFPIDHSFLCYKKELLQFGYAVEKISMKEQSITIKKCGGNENAISPE